jgi:hypothetical protein
MSENNIKAVANKVHSSLIKYLWIANQIKHDNNPAWKAYIFRSEKKLHLNLLGLEESYGTLQLY